MTTIDANENLNIIEIRYLLYLIFFVCLGGHHGRDHMVVGFITTNASSAYHH